MPELEQRYDGLLEELAELIVKYEQKRMNNLDDFKAELQKAVESQNYEQIKGEIREMGEQVQGAWSEI
ncbi:unnamed protein product [Sphagnum balticum]